MLKTAAKLREGCKDELLTIGTPDQGGCSLHRSIRRPAQSLSSPWPSNFRARCQIGLRFLRWRDSSGNVLPFWE